MILTAYSRRYPPEVIAGVLAVFAVGLGVRAMYLHRRTLDVRRWRPADGKVTWSVVAEKVKRSRNGPYTVYSPEVRYTYAIGPHQHEGTLIYFGSGTWHKSDVEARRLVDIYTPGTEVRVYVNPTNVKETVLESGDNPEVRRALLQAVGCAVGAVLVFLFRAPLR
jgi:Protein of unknown function (DUF3592)